MVLCFSKLLVKSLAFVSFVLFICTSVFAQRGFSPSKEQLKDLYRAESLLKSFKNDSALALTRGILKDLKNDLEVNSYFGLRARLSEAIALEQKSQELSATPLLHKIIDQSNKKSSSDIYVKASLVMALVHEKEGLKENSIKYLDQAKAAIDKYDIDSLYVNYAIRMASWKRLYESVESAIPYALEVLELAPKFSLKLEEAVGHLLMQSLLRTKDPEEGLRHALTALEIYKELDDFLGQSFMYNSAARSYLAFGDYGRSMAYNDSSIVVVNNGINDKDYENAYLGGLYIVKGEIFEQLGQIDSAFYYNSIGYKMELERQESRFSNKITELEALNKSEKKEQQYVLELKRRNIVLITTLVIFGLTIGLVSLGYNSYSRQKEYGEVLSQQNELITEQANHLKRLDESKSLFYANASHELRTPLTLILEPLDTLLKKENLNEQQKIQLLTIARQGGITLKNVISQILDLSKLDGGNMQLHLKPTSVHAFFGIWLAQFESLGHTKRLRFSIDNRIPEDLVAMLDQEKCRQIISNLISNAVKFTEREGKVHVTVRYIDGRLKLNVSDTGRGIDSEDLPYVFDRYFQATKKDELAQGGMGIGLALCRDYAELMGGNISVTSVPPEGSSFSVEFPLELADDLQEEGFIYEEEYVEDLQLITNSDTRKPTLLVVEDNSTLQHYLHLLLSEDYEVLLAENGEVALEIIKNIQRVDLIISDLMMPVMDGYQLLTTLKSNVETSDIPVIMLTARAEKDARLKALRIGVDDYITKPFENDELRIRIANLLKNYQVRKLALQENVENNVGHSEADKEWMETFDVFIQKIYLKSTINIPDLAEEFAMSESSLLRKIKQLTGLSPQQYIQELRLNRAYELLNNTTNNYSVQRIALQIGYKDTRSFSRAFKNRFGKLPSTVISQ